MTISISNNGLHLIEEFEGFRSELYLDSGGVPTIGFGTTAGAGVVDPLPKTCTEAQAQVWLAEYVNKSIIPGIERAIEANHVVLNQNQVDALCSFAYNLGAGIFEDNYIGADLRAGNLAKVSTDLLAYDHDNGQVLQGLLNRRKAEQALFNTPVKPPTPQLPKSLPYTTFDGTVISTPFGKLSERATVEKYDSLRPNISKNKSEIQTLETQLQWFADRVDMIAHRETKPGQNPDWSKFERGSRLQQLLHRSQGQEFSL